MKRAIIYGSAMASFCVEKFGTERIKELDLDEIHDRVEEFIRYVESDNFDFSLLNYGKEMEFLELIYNKSLQFLKKVN